MALVRRDSGDADICTRYRPRKLSEIVGLASVSKALDAALKAKSRPKAFLFYGERGCGKTTIARILAMGLNCEEGDTVEPCLECKNCQMSILGHAFHITELNIAQLNKKEDAEEIVKSMAYTTMTGRNKVYIFDEAHQMTAHAQNLLLKNLEEPPAHTYIIMCTTEPKKLLTTVRSRCETYEFKVPNQKEIVSILGDVFSQEDDWELNDEDKWKFLELMEGKAYREILKAVDQVVRGGIEVLSFPDTERPEFIEICRHLAKGNFKPIAAAIKQMKKVDGTIDCEGMRLCILGYLKSIMLNSGASINGLKAAAAIQHFFAPYYDNDAEPKLVYSLLRGCLEMNPTD